jgi:hypothetical protein
VDIKKILKIKGLKYWVATAVFLVVILFLDPNNLFVTMRLRNDVRAGEDSIHSLEEAIRAEGEEKQTLNDIDAKEHFGRENYFMKRDDEVIYKRRKKEN